MDSAMGCDCSHSSQAPFVSTGLTAETPWQSIYDESFELRNVGGCNYRLHGVRCPRSLWHVPRVLRSHPPAAKSRSSSQARHRACRLTRIYCPSPSANVPALDSWENLGGLLTSPENRQLNYQLSGFVPTTDTHPFSGTVYAFTSANPAFHSMSMCSSAVSSLSPVFGACFSISFAIGASDPL
jgi:hypothetical protein